MEVGYDQDPDTYKQARKRIQNRESAIRSRYRKKQYFTELEVKVEDLEEENKRLATQNATLVAEKRLLSEQLDYFKMLVGNMQPGFSNKSTDARSRETLSRDGSIYDEHKELMLEPRYDMMDGELPHLGNYKRPIGSRNKSEDHDEDRLFLSRNNESSVASTAGLFFVAVLMCVMCVTSLTFTGGQSETNSRDFKVEEGGRHLLALQKQHEEITSLLRITMWLIFFISLGIAYFTRISFLEGQNLGKRILIKCRILKDPTKKTKYS